MKLEEQVSYSVEDIQDILAQFGLKLVNDMVVSPKNGRIASNLMAQTNQGLVFIRAYPASYAYEKVVAEVMILDWLCRSGVRVPVPIYHAQEGLVLRRQDGTAIFLYWPLPGAPLEQNQLSPLWAAQAGQLLDSFVHVAGGFSRMTGMVSADPDFIGGIFRQLLERNPAYYQYKICQQMLELLDDTNFIRALEKTPSGLVHADFFFENVVYEQERLTGILDFGDACYGKILNDIVIGAMEFSVLVNDEWDPDCLRAFVAPLKPWLVEHGIGADLCLWLMRANCVRFATYTMPYTEQQQQGFDENPYVRRFLALGAAPLRDMVLAVF